MREIKFRGKRTDTGEWVYGSLVFEVDGTFIYYTKDIGNGNNSLCSYEVIPESVGQFTGLKDKNGTEIYEGDIVKTPDNYDDFGMQAGEINEIYFAFGGFRLKPIYTKKAKGFWLEDNNIFEVIGNIYENPELLGKKK